MGHRDFVDKIMNTPMDRKEFLRYMGVVIIGIMGVNSVISAFLRHHPEGKKLTQKASSGSKFGTSRYGV